MNKKIAFLIAGLITTTSISIAYAAETAFKDVPADFWGKDAINWAAEAGLMGKNNTGGYTENFRPNEPMTRAEIATVLQRYYKMTNPELTSEELEDKITTVIDVATANGNFSTLVTLINNAGLVELLEDDGPFTLFAPNNTAFNNIDSSTILELNKPENKQKLVRLLTYHIVQGKYTTSSLTNGQKLKTIQGQELTVKITYSGPDNSGTKTIMIDEAKLVTKDLFTNNGVIHELDVVVTPEVKTAVPAATTTTTPATTTGTTTTTTGTTTPSTTTTPTTTTPAS
jgi:uncharacterized surface protein with fasciclin (FAS1) repeats